MDKSIWEIKSDKCYCQLQNCVYSRTILYITHPYFSFFLFLVFFQLISITLSNPKSFKHQQQVSTEKLWNIKATLTDLVSRGTQHMLHENKAVYKLLQIQSINEQQMEHTHNAICIYHSTQILKIVLFSNHAAWKTFLVLCNHLKRIAQKRNILGALVFIRFSKADINLSLKWRRVISFFCNKNVVCLWVWE